MSLEQAITTLFAEGDAASRDAARETFGQLRAELTAGRVRVTDGHGRQSTYGPGDSFVMPAGFAGLWEVLEPAQKFYAIYEPAAS